MTKETTPSFVLTLEMKTDLSIIRESEKDLEVSRVIYNTCLGELLKREKQMKRTKRYKKLKRCLRAIVTKLSYYENKKDKNKETKEKLKFYQNEKNQIMKDIFDIQKEFGLFEYSMHEYLKPIRFHFGNTLNADIAQKAATRSWNTFYKKRKPEL